MSLLIGKMKKKFEEKWKKWQPDVRLVTLYSYYRSIIQPLTKFIDTVEHKATNRIIGLQSSSRNLFLRKAGTIFFIINPAY